MIGLSTEMKNLKYKIGEYDRKWLEVTIAKQKI